MVSFPSLSSPYPPPPPRIESRWCSANRLLTAAMVASQIAGEDDGRLKEGLKEREDPRSLPILPVGHAATVPGGFHIRRSIFLNF